MTDFQYDIAFSFTTQDENIATQISDLLQDRYRTFLYSKAQEKLAGTDGEDTFSAVFKEQARSVAVLLRPEWGNTPWTRIEQSAIRHRAYYHGYDFTTFIVTVPGTPIPDWLHPTRIWYDLKRFGVDGAAAVLAARIQERGGAAVEETLADRTARLERTQKFNCEKEAFANSEEGVNASRAAHQRLIADIKANSDMLGKVGCRIHERAYDGTTKVVGRRVVLAVRYNFRVANKLDGAKLVANFCDGVPPLGKYDWEQPGIFKSWEFTFQLVGPDRSAWVGPDGKQHSPEDMAEFLLKHFLDSTATPTRRGVGTLKMRPTMTLRAQSCVDRLARVRAAPQAAAVTQVRDSDGDAWVASRIIRSSSEERPVTLMRTRSCLRRHHQGAQPQSGGRRPRSTNAQSKLVETPRTRALDYFRSSSEERPVTLMRTRSCLRRRHHGAQPTTECKRPALRSALSGLLQQSPTACEP